MEKNIKQIFLDLFFPKFCFGCQKEGTYLCQDCESTLEILSQHSPFRGKFIEDLYFPLYHESPLLKKLIKSFKYEPFIKDLSSTLSRLIIHHFLLLDKLPYFLKRENGFFIIPIPLARKRLKWRGFNQAEELGKEIGKYFNLPVLVNILEKKKETKPQATLSEKERRKNVLGSFSLKKGSNLKGKKIILLDDVYTTGTTMTECARVLKEKGEVKEVIGLVVAKSRPFSQ